MNDTDEHRQLGIAVSWLRHWAAGITTNPPSGDACRLVLAEIERLRTQVRSMTAASEQITEWRMQELATITDLAGERDRLRQQRDAALALHTRVDDPGGAYCRQCDLDGWPCANAVALGVDVDVYEAQQRAALGAAEPSGPTRRTRICTCSGTEDPPLPSEMDPRCWQHGAGSRPPDGPTTWTDAANQLRAALGAGDEPTTGGESNG